MKASVALFGLLVQTLAFAARAQTGTAPPPPPAQAGQPAPGSAPPGGSGLSSGGLAPPEAIESEGQPGQNGTEADLEKAEKQDSGRGLEWFWMNGEIGVEHLGLETFHANDLVDAGTINTTQTGPVYGGGLGLRMIFLTAGARFRLASFSKWQLWTLNAELGLRIPLGSLEPYFTFGGGYASLGSFDSGNVGPNLNSAGVDVTGFNVRGGFGLDVYLTEVFSLGANLTGDIVVLTRPKVSSAKIAAAAGTSNAAALVYAEDGSGVGAGGTLTLVAGLHF